MKRAIYNLKEINSIGEQEFKENEIKCLHLSCYECNGSGIKKNGQSCFHMISCRCERCNPCSYKSQVRYTDFPPEKW